MSVRLRQGVHHLRQGVRHFLRLDVRLRQGVHHFPQLNVHPGQVRRHFLWLSVHRRQVTRPRRRGRQFLPRIAEPAPRNLPDDSLARPA